DASPLTRPVAPDASYPLTINNPPTEKLSLIVQRRPQLVVAAQPLPVPDSGNSLTLTPSNETISDESSPESLTTESVASRGMLQSFRALDDDLSVIPPDTNGAVGPGRLIVALNSQIQTQTRTGALESGPISFRSFWNLPAAGSVEEPRI